MNPYSSVDLAGALHYAGRGFGEGEAFKATVGTGLSLLKGTRDFLSGFGSGKQEKANYNDYIKKLYEDTTNPQALQQGGYSNADILAMNAITDQGKGNVTLEGGEHVKRTDGTVQPVVGEPHIKNGKVAEGVDATLNNGDKVLSDYIKLRPQDVKELKDRYKISLRKGDTPAKALDKIEAKIGLKKETEKLADLAKKLEKTFKITDETTKELNIEALQTVIAKQNEKISTLKEVSAEAFDEIFELQEEQPKKGDGKTLYDKNGKEVTEELEDNKQQGGMQLTPEEERRSIAPQMPISRILYNVETNEVKEGSLAPGKYVRVDYTNGKKDYLTDEGYEDFKRMSNYQIYMANQAKKNQPVTQNPPMASLQQGGVMELAKKHGISEQRAQELMGMMMQEGGENQQITPEQIIQAFAELTQQDPLTVGFSIDAKTNLSCSI